MFGLSPGDLALALPLFFALLFEALESTEVSLSELLVCCCWKLVAFFAFELPRRLVLLIGDPPVFILSRTGFMTNLGRMYHFSTTVASKVSAGLRLPKAGVHNLSFSL